MTSLSVMGSRGAPAADSLGLQTLTPLSPSANGTSSRTPGSQSSLDLSLSPSANGMRRTLLPVKQPSDLKSDLSPTLAGRSIAIAHDAKSPRSPGLLDLVEMVSSVSGPLRPLKQYQLTDYRYLVDEIIGKYNLGNMEEAKSLISALFFIVDENGQNLFFEALFKKTHTGPTGLAAKDLISLYCFIIASIPDDKLVSLDLTGHFTKIPLEILEVITCKKKLETFICRNGFLERPYDRAISLILKSNLVTLDLGSDESFGKVEELSRAARRDAFDLSLFNSFAFHKLAACMWKLKQFFLGNILFINASHTKVEALIKKAWIGSSRHPYLKEVRLCYFWGSPISALFDLKDKIKKWQNPPEIFLEHIDLENYLKYGSEGKNDEKQFALVKSGENDGQNVRLSEEFRALPFDWIPPNWLPPVPKLPQLTQEEADRHLAATKKKNMYAYTQNCLTNPVAKIFRPCALLTAGVAAVATLAIPLFAMVKYEVFPADWTNRLLTIGTFCFLGWQIANKTGTKAAEVLDNISLKTPIVKESDLPKMLKIARENPYFEHMWRAVNQTLPLEIKLYNKTDHQKCPSRGHYSMVEIDGKLIKHGILIANEVNKYEAFRFLVFEMANAFQAERFMAIRSKAKRGELSKEEFTMLLEVVEYATSKFQALVMDYGIHYQGWFTSMLNDNVYVHLYPESKKREMPLIHLYWENANMQSKDIPSHSDVYREDWDQKYKEIYIKTQMAAKCKSDGNP